MNESTDEASIWRTIPLKSLSRIARSEAWRLGEINLGAALAVARRREFGMLRHLGVTRRQVAAMLASEGFVVSGIGLAVGLVLGFLMSLVLIHVVNRQSFHWGMEIHMPWASLALLCVTLLALAVLTTVISARQAMGRDVIRAVKDDW